MSCLRVGQLAIGLASASALAQGGGLDAARCTFNGKPLAGRVQVVNSPMASWPTRRQDMVFPF
jgi:hypothetical protein